MRTQHLCSTNKFSNTGTSNTFWKNHKISKFKRKCSQLYLFFLFLF